MEMRQTRAHEPCEHGEGDANRSEARPDHAGLSDAQYSQKYVTAILEKLQGEVKEIALRFEPETGTLWTTMTPPGRPCFTRQLVDDYIHLFTSLNERLSGGAFQRSLPLKYIVYRSKTPQIFSLGGDLELFSRLIRERDEAGLRDYAHACARMTYLNSISAGLPIITIALVEGQALGGGLESALSCNLILAEKNASFGLPEVLFNLFPGMGAYSYLQRKTSARTAEKLMLSGRSFHAEEMLQEGVIDLLVENGEGEKAVRAYIERTQRRHNAQVGIYRTRRRVTPLSFEELRDVTDIWVDCALGVGEADLRKMEKLVRAQERLRPAQGHPLHDVQVA
ncbi:crotonase/enoyl-CoA hydratase family protein [Afifella pfennigii]|uniref:crotonase/enoyl-CoA hydratase family protein n=1 Tax=Afifella pfennigii TaxID=209897 RepID=UPI0006925C7C|nr:crotonase/enoyl-CoA hydratase family protein [Afifella pfennigii]